MMQITLPKKCFFVKKSGNKKQEIIIPGVFGLNGNSKTHIWSSLQRKGLYIFYRID